MIALFCFLLTRKSALSLDLVIDAYRVYLGTRYTTFFFFFLDLWEI